MSSSSYAHVHVHDHVHEAEHEHEHNPPEIHPGHGHSYYPSKREACPQGKAYYVCAISPFKGCCSTDPCSTGLCADYPHDPAWKPSPSPGLATATESVTGTQTAIGSYTTTVTVTMSHVTATSTLSAGATVTETTSDAVSSSASSSASEVSGLSGPSVMLTSTHPSTLSKSHTTTHSPSSSPFLSIPLSTSSPKPTSPSGGTIAGITLGLTGSIAFLILLCCFCVRRRRKNAVEDKELKRSLKEAAAVQVERNKALRALESRRTGGGSEGAWPKSPRFSTAFPGRRNG